MKNVDSIRIVVEKDGKSFSHTHRWLWPQVVPTPTLEAQLLEVMSYFIKKLSSEKNSELI